MKNLISAIICISILFASPFIGIDNCLAKPQIGIRVDVGLGYTPMNDWVEWTQEFNDVNKGNPTFYSDIGLCYQFDAKHCIAIEAGLIKTDVTTNGIMHFTSGNDTVGVGVFVNKHIFQTIPVGFSYQYYPLAREKFGFFIAAHASVLLTNLYTTQKTLYSDYVPETTYELKSNAKGYSIGASLGVEVPVVEKLSIFSRLRAQYADGTTSFGSDRACKIEFTGVDFNSGFCWYF